MDISILFLANSALLGIGLAVDAFSVSLANGLNEPNMKKSKLLLVAGVFAAFQAAMPLIGWTCVHTILQYFQMFEKAIPWIALILLCFIGGKMLLEGLREKPQDAEPKTLGLGELLAQGVATSIDALSVGFTIAEYDILMALLCAGIIAAVTFFLCWLGLVLGKRFGTKFAGKAGILGGCILIAIGIEIFVRSFH